MRIPEANFNELITKVKGRFYDMGVRSEQNFHEAIDQILEEEQGSGILPDDFDVESMRSKLRAEWRDMEEKKEV